VLSLTRRNGDIVLSSLTRRNCGMITLCHPFFLVKDDNTMSPFRLVKDDSTMSPFLLQEEIVT
jgi:hypothetical protein